MVYLWLSLSLPLSLYIYILYYTKFTEGAVIELIQGLGVMWPDDEDIIYIPYPEGRFPEGGF